MDRAEFEQYIARFNAEDPTAFDDYLRPEVRILNGTLALEGVEGMKAHYCERIWPHYRETLNLQRFVGNENTVAIELFTNFRAKHDAEDTIFGPVREGDQFDYRGLIMYDVVDGRFASITVSYNSFSSTPLGGETRELGIIH